jgi:phosphoribosylamine-glycine ligase
VDLNIIGTGAALEKGIANLFNVRGPKIFFPAKEAAASTMIVIMKNFGLPVKLLAWKICREKKDVQCFQPVNKWEGKDKIVTAGGRVLGVTSIGENLESVIEKACQSVKKINFQDA